MTLERLVLITGLIANIASIIISGVAIWHMRAYIREKTIQNLKHLKDKL